MSLNTKLLTAVLAGVLSVGALTACAPDNDASEGSTQTQPNNDDAPGLDNPAANDDAPGLDDPSANDDAPGLDDPGTDNSTEINDGDGEAIDDNNDLDNNNIDDPANPNDSQD